MRLGLDGRPIKSAEVGSVDIIIIAVVQSRMVQWRTFKSGPQNLTQQRPYTTTTTTIFNIK